MKNPFDLSVSSSLQFEEGIVQDRGVAGKSCVEVSRSMAQCVTVGKEMKR